MGEKIVVPEGMLSAATATILKRHGHKSVGGTAVGAYEAHKANCAIALEAGIRWQRDYVLTDEDIEKIVNKTQWSGYQVTARTLIHAYLNYMFLAPNVDTFARAATWDLRWDVGTASADELDRVHGHNNAVLEAYKRGAAAQRGKL